MKNVIYAGCFQYLVVIQTNVYVCIFLLNFTLFNVPVVLVKDRL